MSARTKIHGNRAVLCDVAGCASRFVAQSWINNATDARRQASRAGWTRVIARGAHLASWLDHCPQHAAAP